ncbi:MAG: antitoxin VapB family protein [Candidatus Jordarchaeum sp.]|uniref:antitoxin VapB family protein n=1 Tax=Candidatus Jordarchaeum sp. TaxID=2823881 RepID=UPI00404A9D95
MTKTISLSDEAYKLLKSIKRNDESFSDVIKRLVGKKGKLIEVLDLYPELSDVQGYEEAVSSIRKEIDRRLEHEMY